MCSEIISQSSPLGIPPKKTTRMQENRTFVMFRRLLPTTSDVLHAVNTTAG